MFEPNPFTPVPLRTRRDGWTPDRQRAFIAALEQTGSISRAAECVGLSRKSAYQLRDRTDAASFAKAWDEAFARSRRAAPDPRIIRAIEGELVPVFYGGLQRGEKRVYDDAMLMRLLRSAWRRQRGSLASSQFSQGVR